MDNDGLGKILKQQRITIPMTLQELAAASKVSSSHLGRIERGERFPSARILRKIAEPLGFEEDYLFTLAGLMSPKEDKREEPVRRELDPIVSRILAEEPIEVQRAVITILSVVKGIAKGIVQEKH